MNQTFQIKCRFSGEILYEFKTKSLMRCVEAAIESGANLSGANLSWANLSGANLYPDSIAEWKAFTDNEIYNMDKEFLSLWHTHKESIFSICSANGRE